MSVAANSVRLAAATVGLGLSLAGPQALSVAAADAPDRGSPVSAHSAEPRSSAAQPGQHGSGTANRTNHGPTVPRVTSVRLRSAAAAVPRPTFIVIVPNAGSSVSPNVTAAPPTPAPAQTPVPAFQVASILEGVGLLVRRSWPNDAQSIKQVPTSGQVADAVEPDVVAYGPIPGPRLSSFDVAGSRIHNTVDKNYESHVNESGAIIRDRLIPSEGTDPAEYSDILKFSNCADILVDNSTILGGKEDAIDAVRGSGYTFNNLTLIPTYNGITVKGAIDDVLIENITFEKHGSNSDLEFGQFDNYCGVPPVNETTQF